LRVLVPAAGAAAFALVLPVTVALLVVLGFLILSYRQTIKEYPTAGGAYVVTKDNFGAVAAQVAGASLLTDYVLTVSVSVSAGTAALTSAFSGLRPYAVPISLFFIAIIAYGNLRGVRESGKIFAVPTYFFIANMGLLLAAGAVRAVTGTLAQAPRGVEGQLPFGQAGDGLLLGASLFVVMRAFASGGAAVTGVEAISNGVSAFKVPEWKNARSTLVVMGSLLGVMFLGLSALAARTHTIPYEKGTPTVIAQIGKIVYGGGLGNIFFYSLQAGTMLILVLAANTSFADFPRLASFAAEDGFLPRQFTKRGHRLVFSNGVISLSLASAVLVIGTGAQVDRLIPLYAIGVFTSFTLSQAGMARHHIRHKEIGWRKGLFVNGFGAILSLVVDIIIAITKFTHGAWMILVAVPIFVGLFLRTNRIYRKEQSDLSVDIASLAPPLPRHRVVVLVDGLDRASLGALQYARQLRPLSTVALHVAVDPEEAGELAQKWAAAHVPYTLEVLDCPLRDLEGEVVKYVRELIADPGTEVTVLVPRRRYSRFWHRILHDGTSSRLTKRLSKYPHVNLTMVPFTLGERTARLEPVPAPPLEPEPPESD
jgi:amino acid transporter